MREYVFLSFKVRLGLKGFKVLRFKRCAYLLLGFKGYKVLRFRRVRLPF